MLEIEPLTATIGAEVSAIDLATIDDQTARFVTEALLRWKVLAFRHQQLSARQLLSFSARFGEPEIHPNLPSDPTHPEVTHLESTAELPYAASRWHFDASWGSAPNFITVLHAVEAPPVGGDTLFADTGAAFARLATDWRRRAVGRFAVHGTSDGSKRSCLPLVRAHPVTGSPALFVTRDLASHIDGLPRDESDVLLDHLGRAIADPSVQCRIRWHPGTVVVWDNCCTQHYATDDYFPAVRRMQRVTIAGSKPEPWLAPGSGPEGGVSAAPARAQIG